MGKNAITAFYHKSMKLLSTPPSSAASRNRTAVFLPHGKLSFQLDQNSLQYFLVIIKKINTDQEIIPHSDVRRMKILISGNDRLYFVR